jgi:hypothetical protein
MQQTVFIGEKPQKQKRSIFSDRKKKHDTTTPEKTEKPKREIKFTKG